MRSIRRLMAAYGTRRGWVLLFQNSSVAFAALAGTIQLFLTVRPTPELQGGSTLAGVALLSLAWGVVFSAPRTSVSRSFTHPSFTVTVKEGDLFDEEGGLVVGFTDVFDTSVEGGDIISPRSVQAQFMRNVYADDEPLLSRDLAVALSNVPVRKVEDPTDKPRGKRERYPVGTVAVLGRDGRKYYCVAYSTMTNDLIAKSSVDQLWNSLNELWSAVASNGHREAISMPVLGSDLARVNSLDRESLAKMIILSCVSKSRQEPLAESITLVIPPKDMEEIDMNEMSAFINSL
ncbi:macro domain-containing protein [Streptomyces sp. NPDC002044]|uniref:macro domain-containing protein n=1 Tax=Streptomyces sp. NPDC002044 TaxID=3154662 RepID=UPI003328654F